MIVLIVILTIIVFVIVDFLLRTLMQRVQKVKLEKERSEALYVGLRLDFTSEAKSLKRVEVQNPKAKILCVDDEPVILDSFRKILVVDGYSVDTVETGAEVLGLIQKRDYDFVFTDLKMPEMDGVDVTKAVKHLRPDIDVIVITGYAAVETAVETMKFGAMDYVQKPFTEGELIEFVNKSLIKRQEKIEKQMKPTVRLVTGTTAESSSKHEFNVPAGVFIAHQHTWITIEMNGIVRIGIDDFIRKILRKIDGVELPKIGSKIKKGDLLFTIKQEHQSFDIPSPISGRVISVNSEHAEHPEWIVIKPFELSWMCLIEPSSLSEELHYLKIGRETIDWYQQEINKYNEILRKAEKEKEQIESSGEGNNAAEKERLDKKIWGEFSQTFLNKK